MIRRQPPVYSPLGAGALYRAFRTAWAPTGEGARTTLSAILESRYDADRVILTGSGTEALTAAIRVAHPEEDAPVALPAFTCYDVGTAAVGAGRPIILYDVDPTTLGPDWASLEAALTSGARTIVVASLYGVPVDWDRVQDLATRHDAAVIEDAAQGVGASWRGRPLGSLGPVSVLSFGRGKGWTGGRGGAVLLRGETASLEEPYRVGTTAIREASVALAALAQWILTRPSLYELPRRLPWLHLGETRYHEPNPPQRMPRVAAALAAAVIDEVDRESALRRRTATLLRSGAARNPEIELPVEPEHGVSGYLRLPCRVLSSRERDRILSDLAAVGVAPSYPRSLDRVPQIRDHLARTDSVPGAEALAAELVTLPTHSLLERRDTERLEAGLAPRK